jgi:hypothetical protein
MKIRKQTLEEWFVSYQTSKAFKEHHFNQWHLNIDISAIVHNLLMREDAINYTTILLKGVGLWMAANPEANRMLMHTFLGRRVVELGHTNINMPILVTHQNQDHLLGMIVTQPDLCSLTDIRRQIKATKQKPLSETKVLKYVVGRPNNWFTRTRLKIIYNLIFRSPSLYAKSGASAVSVSSTLNNNAPGLDLSFFAYGPTGITFSCTSVTRTLDDRYLMHIGVTSDHHVWGGNAAAKLLASFADIMQSTRPEEILRFS